MIIIDSIEKTAKNVDDAVKDALKDLSTSIDQVEITVLSQGSSGFLGLGSRPAKVLVEKRFDPQKIAETFLREVISGIGISVQIEAELVEKHLYINMIGEHVGLIIGKRGHTLDSLQYLISLVVNKGNTPFITITLDTENYRKRRKDTLEQLAHNLARKVKHTKQDVWLEPMSSHERRIIHSALQGDRYIYTHSHGEEPHRNVIIALKSKE